MGEIVKINEQIKGFIINEESSTIEDSFYFLLINQIFQILVQTSPFRLSPYSFYAPVRCLCF